MRFIFIVEVVHCMDWTRSGYKKCERPNCFPVKKEVDFWVHSKWWCALCSLCRFDGIAQCISRETPLIGYLFRNPFIKIGINDELRMRVHFPQPGNGRDNLKHLNTTLARNRTCFLAHFNKAITIGSPNKWCLYWTLISIPIERTIRIFDVENYKWW